MEPSAREESARIKELRSLNLLDTPAEERFDRLTRLAKKLFDVPIVLFSLVDSERQWFKSNIGLDITETGRDISFCSHAIWDDGVFIVRDATKDPRFSKNPLVLGYPNIRFYAAAPIIMPSGFKLGTICLIDTTPRELSMEERDLLLDLSAVFTSELSSQQAANVDALTKVNNRRGFNLLALKTIENSKRYGWKCSLVFLDLNGFKSINDNFGHSVGDQALVEFSQILTRNIRESDVVARIGGDEFVLLLMNSDYKKAKDKLSRVERDVEKFNLKRKFEFKLAVSYGIVEYSPERHISLENVMSEADEEMYIHKHSKRNNYLPSAKSE